MSKVAGVVQFKAKPGLGRDVADSVAAARPLVEKESGTLVWLVLRSESDPDIVFLVDVFADASSLSTHMQGAAAHQILGSVRSLLAEDVQLHPSTIVSAKGA